MQLSTTTRIGLGYALLSMFLLSIFSFILSVFFAQSRKRQEKSLLRLHAEQTQALATAPRSLMAKNQLQQRFIPIIELDRADPLVHALFPHGQQDRILGQTTLDETTYLFYQTPYTLFLKDISMQVQRQRMLHTYLLWGIIMAGVLSFLLGKLFAQWALRDLYHLAEQVANLDIEHLDFRHMVNHLPAHDEIVVLADALQTMTIKLEQQVYDVKQFVSNAAHELRTPLMVLRSTIDLAHKTKKYEKTLPKIQSTIVHMEELIATLLMLARNESYNFSKETVDVQAMMTHILEQCQLMYTDKHLHIDVPTTSLDIQAHPNSLERILFNLVENAYKYTADGGSIIITRDEEQWVITDTGKGMNTEEQAHMRTPFWQADVSKGEDMGFGLGLSLVERLVHLHGWTILVASEQGVGTTFRIKW